MGRPALQRGSGSICLPNSPRGLTRVDFAMHALPAHQCVFVCLGGGGQGGYGARYTQSNAQWSFQLAAPAAVAFRTPASRVLYEDPVREPYLRSQRGLHQ